MQDPSLVGPFNQTLSDACLHEDNAPLQDGSLGQSEVLRSQHSNMMGDVWSL